MPRKMLNLARRSASPGRNGAKRAARKNMHTGKPPRRTTEVDQETDQNPLANLGPDITTKIGNQLSRMYDEIVNQRVPERFVEILRGLDRQGGGSKNESR
jgi:hypothetical protein